MHVCISVFVIHPESYLRATSLVLCFCCAATSVDKGDCMGGSTLSLLHDRTFNYTGDSQAQELCLYLTKAASVPYFEMLEKWIYRGIIKDPYGYRKEKQQSTWFTLVVLDPLFLILLFQLHLNYYFYQKSSINDS